MNSWLREIRVGDACRIDETDYRVAGTLACLQPDSTFWTEWLLVPEGQTTSDAVSARTARRLGWEPDVGALLWISIEPPASASLADVAGLRGLVVGERQYRRAERDSFVLSNVTGEAGPDHHRGERFDYLEMLAGTARLRLQWNARGVQAAEGRKVSPLEVRDWFAQRGVALDRRSISASAPAVRREAAMSHDRRAASEEVGAWAIALVIAIPLILLENCSSDCRQERINPTTGQAEYVCADGSVRSSRPWFGK